MTIPRIDDNRCSNAERATVRRWFASVPRWVVWIGVPPVAGYACMQIPGVFWGSLCVIAVAAVMVAGLRFSGPHVERWRRAQDARDARKLFGKMEQRAEIVLVEPDAPYRGGHVQVELAPEPARPTMVRRTQWLLFRRPDPLADRLALESEAEGMEAKLERKMRAPTKTNH